MAGDCCGLSEPRVIARGLMGKMGGQRSERKRRIDGSKKSEKGRGGGLCSAGFEDGGRRPEPRNMGNF